MYKLLLYSLLVALFPSPVSANENAFEIALGSCLRQGKPQPIWNAINQLNPDVFLFIGDNVYADTIDPTVMNDVYSQLGAQPGFQRLRNSCPVYATWDDHDYGANDAGADYPMKVQSEEIFLDFFDVPKDAPERQRSGIYSSKSIDALEYRLQIILLDTRYFRSPLLKIPSSENCPRANHRPNTDPTASILGKEQWSWLEEQLHLPADIRIIASSIQVIPEQHCFEKWANFPLERDRLFELIQDSAAQNVILVSGDRHLAEISRIEIDGMGQPLYELTSSGMNSAGAGKGEANRYRVHADNFREDNFGVIKISSTEGSPSIELQIRNVDGDVAVSTFTEK